MTTLQFVQASRGEADAVDVIIHLPKCVLVLSRQQFIAALRRGKGWKRRQAMAQRLQKTGESLDG